MRMKKKMQVKELPLSKMHTFCTKSCINASKKVPSFLSSRFWRGFPRTSFFAICTCKLSLIPIYHYFRQDSIPTSYPAASDYTSSYQPPASDFPTSYPPAQEPSYQAEPPSAAPTAPVPTIPDQPPPWQASFAEDSSEEESEEESDYDPGTSSMPPPPNMAAPALPDGPPPVHEFSKSCSLSLDGSLSTFSTNYCIGNFHSQCCQLLLYLIIKSFTFRHVRLRCNW